jgi:hypothetical protein
MSAWWVGTLSTVIGALTGAVLQMWHERTTYKRQMSVRWDETLLAGLVDYLTAADRALRTLLQWRRQHDQIGDEVSRIAAAATDAFEVLHEKSHLVALLSGDRNHPIRVSARTMRETLLPICEQIQGRRALSDQQAGELVSSHRRARNALIGAVQEQLKREA